MVCEGDEYLKMRKEEIDMNRLFDLEKALQGHPVVLRNGKKAYVRHYEKELETLFPLTGFIVNDCGERVDLFRWKDNGSNGREEYPDLGDDTDIVGMWQDPAKIKVINGHEVPDTSFTPREGERYYFPDPSRPSLYDIRWFISSDEYGVHRLRNNMCYPATDEGKEAAIAHAKALLKTKTCYDCFIDTFSDYVLGRGYGNLGQCIELAEDSYDGYNEDMPIPDYAEEVLNEIARGV